jgi:hypothetical protein
MIINYIVFSILAACALLSAAAVAWAAYDLWRGK